MDGKLYFIINCGCDDETRGLTRLTDEEFENFKTIVDDLNKNSTYECMPTITVYEARESDLRKVTDEDDIDDISDHDRFHLNGEIYTWASSEIRYSYAFLWKCVI